MNPQVDRDHYFKEEYLSQDRFLALREQVVVCRESNSNSFLEVGPGPGLLTSLLRNFGKKVTTLDFDIALQPDIVGSILNIPCESGCFDTICCFQVLEHLPFEAVPQALREMSRVSKNGVVFSVPDHAGLRTTKLGIRVQVLNKEINVHYSRPIFPGITNPDEHYWEIGCHGVDTLSVINAINGSNLRCSKHYLPCAYFHFFICDKLQL